MTRTADLDELVYMTWLLAEGHTDVRPLPDGRRWAGIRPLMFTHAIFVGQIGDKVGYDDRWCYHSYQDAKQALEAWTGEGEPSGWHRNPRSGRRRPDGDPAQEYVDW
ncbi:hypothetical protein [Microvirga massiliensis]|uniref:hypothetical protein n=1 Tax=Microvirga massiliensis TaxID=1033741 RepID=UPI00062BDB2B|nr:hypothetical protein [Microvirga massiliensis]